jgi:hypothetical protein
MSLNRIWRLCALAAVVVGTGFNASTLGDEQTEGLDIQRSPMTGLATFVRSADGGPMGGLLPQLGPVAALPADFFRQHGNLFGVIVLTDDPRPVAVLQELEDQTDTHSGTAKIILTPFPPPARRTLRKSS